MKVVHRKRKRKIVIVGHIEYNKPTKSKHNCRIKLMTINDMIEHSSVAQLIEQRSPKP